MTIEKIRERNVKSKGQTFHFRFNGARNQIEEFEAVILNTYPGVFLVQLKDDTKLVKSFTYADLLTLHLEITDEK